MFVHSYARQRAARRRGCNETAGVSRVVYDSSGKPLVTIE